MAGDANPMWYLKLVAIVKLVILSHVTTKDENGKAGHESERKLTEYREFRKRTNLSEIMSNTVGIRKFNTEY
jgi:hypothetical protein